MNGIAYYYPLLIVGIGFFVPTIFSILFYRRSLLGMAWGLPIWLGACSVGAVVTSNGLGLLPFRPKHTSPERELEFIIANVCAGLLVVFVTPFVLRFYNKWMGRSLEESEKASGIEGFRAWLNGWNVAMAALIALFAWQGYDCSFWAVLVLLLGLIAAYPLATEATARTQQSALSPMTAAERPNEGRSEERERILKLLETGKITAEETAELLNALRYTSRSDRTPRATMTTGKVLTLLGTTLVVIAFFVPWYSANISQEVDRLRGMLMQQMPLQGGTPNVSISGMSGQPCSSNTVYLVGGEVAKGLGWVVLSLSVLGTVFLFVKLNVSDESRRFLLLAPVTCGLFVVFYLFAQDFRHVSIGLPVVLAGYVVETIGLIKELRPGND